MMYGAALALWLSLSKPNLDDGLVMSPQQVVAATTHGCTDPLVAIFVIQDCPIANAYSPEFIRLNAQFKVKDMKFLMVFEDEGLSKSAALQHMKDYGMTSIPVCLDQDHLLEHKWKMKSSPEAIVIVNGTPVYRGRIDDRHPQLGVRRETVGHQDLRLVLTNLEKHRRPQFEETLAIGCSLPGAN